MSLPAGRVGEAGVMVTLKVCIKVEGWLVFIPPHSAPSPGLVGMPVKVHTVDTCCRRIPKGGRVVEEGVVEEEAVYSNPCHTVAVSPDPDPAAFISSMALAV